MEWDPAEANRLEAAIGFWELGMPEAALEELSELPSELQQQPEVLQIRLTIFMEENRWPEALAASESLCQAAPTDTDGWIKLAFCLHEMKKTQEARDRLLSGPPALRDCGIYYYNLACYECQLGHIQEAWLLLERAVQLDPNFQKLAQEDDDLAPLRSPGTP